jgi:hypothetical protein
MTLQGVWGSLPGTFLLSVLFVVGYTPAKPWLAAQDEDDEVAMPSGRGCTVIHPPHKLLKVAMQYLGVAGTALYLIACTALSTQSYLMVGMHLMSCDAAVGESKLPLGALDAACFLGTQLHATDAEHSLTRRSPIAIRVLCCMLHRVVVPSTKEPRLAQLQAQGSSHPQTPSWSMV